MELCLICHGFTKLLNTSLNYKVTPEMGTCLHLVPQRPFTLSIVETLSSGYVCNEVAKLFSDYSRRHDKSDVQSASVHRIESKIILT